MSFWAAKPQKNAEAKQPKDAEASAEDEVEVIDPPSDRSETKQSSGDTTSPPTQASTSSTPTRTRTITTTTTAGYATEKPILYVQHDKTRKALIEWKQVKPGGDLAERYIDFIATVPPLNKGNCKSVYPWQDDVVLRMDESLRKASYETLVEHLNEYALSLPHAKISRAIRQALNLLQVWQPAVTFPQILLNQALLPAFENVVANAWRTGNPDLYRSNYARAMLNTNYDEMASSVATLRDARLHQETILMPNEDDVSTHALQQTWSMPVYAGPPYQEIAQRRLLQFNVPLYRQNKTMVKPEPPHTFGARKSVLSTLFLV